MAEKGWPEGCKKMEKKSSNPHLQINGYAEDFDAWIEVEKSGTRAVRREASLGVESFQQLNHTLLCGVENE